MVSEYGNVVGSLHLRHLQCLPPTTAKHNTQISDAYKVTFQQISILYFEQCSTFIIY
jgi:hypothetical protein